MPAVLSSEAVSVAVEAPRVLLRESERIFAESCTGARLWQGTLQNRYWMRRNSLRPSTAPGSTSDMKCPHCNALFASPHATETEANVTNGENKRGGQIEVTVFSCPVCEAVFSVNPGEPSAESDEVNVRAETPRAVLPK
jgi:hypothetical protein